MKKRFQPSAASIGVDMGWGATTSLLGGIVVWGGAGWLLDYWWGTRFATPIGVILGMALGVYAVVMRYGRAPEARPEQTTDPHDGSAAKSAER